MKQNNEIRFKCSTEDKEKIRKKAEKVGMSIKSYLLYLGLNSSLKVTLGENMELYEEIIFLKHFFKGMWVVENVIPYYKPLIKSQIVSRHCFWSNFIINKIKLPTANIKHQETQPKYGFDLEDYQIDNKRIILRNLINPKLGLHVFKCAFKDKQELLK